MKAVLILVAAFVGLAVAGGGDIKQINHDHDNEGKDHDGGYADAEVGVGADAGGNYPRGWVRDFMKRNNHKNMEAAKGEHMDE